MLKKIPNLLITDLKNIFKYTNSTFETALASHAGRRSKVKSVNTEKQSQTLL